MKLEAWISVMGGAVCVGILALVLIGASGAGSSLTSREMTVLACKMRMSASIYGDASITYVVWGKDVRVLEGMRVVEKVGGGTSVMLLSLEVLRSVQNRAAIGRLGEQWREALALDKAWRTEHKVAEVSAAAGSIRIRGKFIVAEAEIRRGLPREGRIWVTEGAYRTHGSFAWVTRELPDGYWTVTFTRYIALNDRRLARAAPGFTDPAPVHLRDSNEIAGYVHDWVGECPGLLVALPRLSFVLKSTPHSMARAGERR